MFMTLERLEIVDFIADPTKTQIAFILRSPPLSYVRNVYTLPFDKFVWISAIALITLVAIIMYSIMNWEWKRENRWKTSINLKSVKPKLDDILMLQIGAICQQGSELVPKRIPGRIATFFIFIAITFMYTSYSAFVVVLFQTTTDSIKTVEDLLVSNIKLGVENSPYSYHYFAVI